MDGNMRQSMGKLDRKAISLKNKREKTKTKQNDYQCMQKYSNIVTYDWWTLQL